MATDSLPSIQNMMKELEEHYVNDTVMNEWENEFYESLTVQLQKGRELSDKQIDKLVSLWRHCASKG